MNWRGEVGAADAVTIGELVAATGFFSAEEGHIAVELAEIAYAQGSASGYEFVLADSSDGLAGFACFGPIPATQGSFDLYWIAVAPGQQRRGLGAEMLHEVERRARGQGARQLYVETSGRAQYEPTRAFYKARGYREAARFPGFYAPGDAKLVFVKRLAPGPD